jgi:hypothetical protein
MPSCSRASYLLKRRYRDRYLDKCVALVFLCSGGLPEDGNPVPKHVGADTYHELYFIISVLMSAFVG